jgi:hypothetical protein
MDRTPPVVLVFGPIAVGKTTVGQALAARTSLTLVHAHMTIDLVTQFFKFGSEPFRRVNLGMVHLLLRELLDQERGAILTHIVNFEESGNSADIAELDRAIASYGGRLVFAELQAPLAERLLRNESPARRATKDVSWATPTYLREWDAHHRTASEGHFPYPDRHLIVETTQFSADEAAEQIKAHFRLD